MIISTDVDSPLIAMFPSACFVAFCSGLITNNEGLINMFRSISIFSIFGEKRTSSHLISSHLISSLTLSADVIHPIVTAISSCVLFPSSPIVASVNHRPRQLKRSLIHATTWLPIMMNRAIIFLPKN